MGNEVVSNPNSVVKDGTSTHTELDKNGNLFPDVTERFPIRILSRREPEAYKKHL